MHTASDSMERRLEAARQAAREGARMLREEFHRPDGPRGYGDHADIDVLFFKCLR